MHSGTVLEQNPAVEEEMVIDVDGHRLVVFADLCPYAVRVGGSYPMVLRATLLENQSGSPSPVGVEAIEPLGNGRYKLRGFVHHDVLSSCGLQFLVEDLPPATSRDTSWMEIEADRISVEFGRVE